MCYNDVSLFSNPPTHARRHIIIAVTLLLQGSLLLYTLMPDLIEWQIPSSLSQHLHTLPSKHLILFEYTNLSTPLIPIHILSFLPLFFSFLLACCVGNAEDCSHFLISSSNNLHLHPIPYPLSLVT